MEAVLNLVFAGCIIAVGVIIAVSNSTSDWKGCEDKGGQGCHNCPFPCEYNHSDKKYEEEICNGKYDS